MKTILVAIDSSRTAESVVAEAIGFARVSKARVVLLTVVQPPVVPAEYAPMLDNITEITAAGSEAAAKHLATLKKRLTVAGIRAVSVQVVGSPVAHILEQAKKQAADYIVMGSHGHTALYDLLLGSTTHGVLFRAPCPVVIVPPKRPRARARKSR